MFGARRGNGLLRNFLYPAVFRFFKCLDELKTASSANCAFANGCNSVHAGGSGVFAGNSARIAASRRTFCSSSATPSMESSSRLSLNSKRRPITAVSHADCSAASCLPLTKRKALISRRAKRRVNFGKFSMLAARRKWVKRNNSGKSGCNAARSAAGNVCHNGKFFRATASGSASSRSMRGISDGNDAVASSVAVNVSKPLAPPPTGVRAFCNRARSAGAGVESMQNDASKAEKVRIEASMMVGAMFPHLR